MRPKITSNQANGLAMCTLAQAYYGNYCMCDANVIGAVTANPALAAATSDVVNQQVASSCATANIPVRAHACASTQKRNTTRARVITTITEPNASLYLEQLPQGTPTSTDLSNCCNAANVMANDACPCVNVDDGYGVDRSISSASDIRLSFILNAPGQGCVDALWFGRVHGKHVHLHVTTIAAAIAAAVIRHYTLPRHVGHRWTNPRRNPS